MKVLRFEHLRWFYFKVDASLRPDHAHVFHAGLARRVRTLLVVHGEGVGQVRQELVGQPPLHQQLRRH